MQLANPCQDLCRFLESMGAKIGNRHKRVKGFGRRRLGWATLASHPTIMKLPLSRSWRHHWWQCGSDVPLPALRFDRRSFRWASRSITMGPPLSGQSSFVFNSPADEPAPPNQAAPWPTFRSTYFLDDALATKANGVSTSGTRFMKAVFLASELTKFGGHAS